MHPARPGQHDRGPPAAGVLRRLGRHEPQVVDLLGDLRDERQAHAGRQEHRAEVEGAVAVLTLVGEELRDRLGVADQQVDERRHHQQQPQRRGPQLQLAQQRHPVHDEREDDDRGRGVAEPQWHTQTQFEALGHDRALEGEEDERERREDDIRDHRAVVAEAAAPGDEVQVQVVAGGVVGQREPGEEDDHREHRDPPQRVDRAVGDADVGADGEVGQVGDAPQRRDGDRPGAPPAVAAGREPEGVVLQGLLRGGGRGRGDVRPRAGWRRRGVLGVVDGHRRQPLPCGSSG